MHHVHEVLELQRYQQKSWGRLLGAPQEETLEVGESFRNAATQQRRTVHLKRSHRILWNMELPSPVNTVLENFHLGRSIENGQNTGNSHLERPPNAGFHII
jgi:hypothetical protein